MNEDRSNEIYSFELKTALEFEKVEFFKKPNC